MRGLGTEIGYGGQVGMEYPLTPDPVPDLDPGGKPRVLTPRLDSVGVGIRTMRPPEAPTGRVTTPMNTAVCPKGIADPARVLASGDQPSSAWRSREAFSNSPLAAIIVRVALAIEERERQAATEAVGAGVPGAQSSGGANEHDGSLDSQAKLGAPSDDVPMRLDAHSVEEAS